MRREHGRYKVFSRRAALLGGGKLVLASTLIARMYYLQVVESDRYRLLAEENRINLRLLPPPRGRILDRFGVPLANNRQNYRAVMVSEQTPDVEETLATLAGIIPLADHEYRRILRELRRKRSFVPVTLRENLSWEEVSRVEVNAPDLPGVMIDVGQSREYPFGAASAHLVGYVGPVAEKEVDSDAMLRLPGFRIGKSGTEKTHERALRGKAGTSQIEVNAFGRVIRELSRREGAPGRDVVLTIDLDLQKLVAERLARETSGAAVVIDVVTGEVLALASTPTFDPGAFNTGLSTDAWKKLTTDPHAPLTNKGIAGQYAPGSTFKMIVALAALEAGVGTDHKVFCRGHVELGTSRFHCWKRGGHGLVDMHKAIEQSCDVYFYDIAKKVGVDAIGRMARRFGFGDELGLDIGGERPGLIPSKSWKRAKFGVPWQQGETLVVGIGQGFVLATPLQLAVMTARLVNGGFAVTPRLTRAIVGEDAAVAPEAPKFKPIGVPASALAVIERAMAAVANDVHGTAFRARIRNSRMAMGGKTGTSQVRRISQGERLAGIRKNKDRQWRDRDHALFVGYAPLNSPRYAVAVVIEHGGSGAATAAPIARDVLLATQRRGPSRRRGQPPSPAPKPEAV